MGIHFGTAGWNIPRVLKERWAAAVPESFRFAAKIPKLISHERLLTRARDPLTRFLDETAGLGTKRGPLLLQLPPSFAFDARRAGRFFELLRRLHEGPVVCEPRHATWVTAAAARLLEKFEVARVAADPPRAEGLQEPGGWRALQYTGFGAAAANALDLVNFVDGHPENRR